MNKYESVIIINPNCTDEAVKALEERFTGLINENGKVESVENMGKKRLAYEIKKNQEATYMLINFEAKPDSIAELETISGYTTGEAVATVGLVNTFTITNTLTKPEKTEVKVTKNWDDNKNSESTRPGSITVNLYGTDKDEPVKTETLNEGNNWSTTFTDLDKNYQGSPINYTVTEDTVENYTQTNEGKECTKDETTGKFECIIENRVNDMPIDIPVTKSWEDNNDQDGKRPETLEVTITGTVDGKPVEGLSKPITLKKSENWTGVFEDMPRFHEGKLVIYTISEGSLPEGYSLDEEKSNLTDRTKFKLVNVVFSFNPFIISEKCTQGN